MEPPKTLRLRFDGFELDEADARLKRDGRPVALAPKAFAVLCTLAGRAGVLVTKDALLDAVWGHRHVSESVLKTTISEVRAALGDDAKQPRYIETAARRGYRFIGRANALLVAAADPELQRPGQVPPTPHVGFIGRAAHLAKLHGAWQRARNGDRQLLWIAGEAGVGKTRLIESFVKEIDAELVAFGQCVEHFGIGEPFLPILDAISELCRRDPALPAIIRACAPTWLVQIPWLLNEGERATLQREVAGAHPDRMVREMRELMDRFTAQRPLVFVLEDLHWSDRGTLHMMEHFARRPRPVKILWIASFRLTQVIAEDHPLRNLRQELRLHKLCEEVLLDPFSESEVAAYLQDRVPSQAVSEAFVRRLHAHTDGLPLFVANVIDALLASDANANHGWLEAAATTPLPVPESLAGVIEKQIARLPAELQPLLQAAAVCGMEFRAALVAKVLEREPDWVSQRCDELVQRRFWLRHVAIVELPNGDFDSRYEFLHALYRHVFYESIALTQRIQLHRRVASHLEALRDAGESIAAAELASHHERGRQPMLAMRYYAEAAQYAAAHFAPADAMRLTEDALRLFDRLPEGQERTELALAVIHQRGVASAQLFGVGARETLGEFERARQLLEVLPETPLRAVLLNGIGISRYVQGEFKQARAIADKVRAIADRHADQVLLMFACTLQGLVSGIQAEHTFSRACYAAGLAAAAALGEARIPRQAFVVDPLVVLRANYVLPLMHLALVDEARAQSQLARERALEVGQPMARMLSLWTAGLLYIRCEAPAIVAALAEELDSVVVAGMLKQGEGPVRWLRGWSLMRHGSAREGFELIREGYQDHVRLGMYAGMSETLVMAAEAALLYGDTKVAQQQIDEGFQLAQRIDERVGLPNLNIMQGRIHQANGDPGAATVAMRAAVEVSRSQGARFYVLKALVALCDLPTATAPDWDALKQAYAELREGLDLPLVKRASQMIHS